MFKFSVHPSGISHYLFNVRDAAPACRSALYNVKISSLSVKVGLQVEFVIKRCLSNDVKEKRGMDSG